ncbi:hypothetical protein SSP24_41800 [Streptomyces spinoverrucosus]|uniref:Uncharacterized protein n=1 Tax=Streptomyces spinoverrucosus TaxID=284043 RepID=A0A4Y3VK82_9ACTN|nr:hypothetical protein SSP24_41800 [Streptomyces spinoverrucosus]GHB54566.1 hypothetical protein GCM10010397_26050 [Streptomyces spinoverrucosus]
MPRCGRRLVRPSRLARGVLRGVDSCRRCRRCGEDDPESLISEQIEYWRKALAGLPDELRLPADRQRPTTPGDQGDNVLFHVSAEPYRKLSEPAARSDARPTTPDPDTNVLFQALRYDGLELPHVASAAGRTVGDPRPADRDAERAVRPCGRHRLAVLHGEAHPSQRLGLRTWFESAAS